MTREELNQHKQQEIINEQRREKRKKITLFVLKISVVLIISVVLFYLYTTFISTSILSVNESRIINKKLPDNFNGLKIIQFSDLHYGTTVFYDDVKEIVQEINKRSPDIVVFTGDLIDVSYDLKTDEQEKIIKLLKKIDTKLGKYAVYGEEDSEVFTTIMKQSNFEVLENSYELLYDEDNTPILLVGLGSKISGNLDIDGGFSYFAEPSNSQKIFTLTISHEPDLVDEVLQNYSTDLFLAGHSHNGNIRIPYIGSLYKVDGAKLYDQAYYKVNDTDLFISSGIGTNGPGFRLFCRPSINFFRVSNR